MKAIRLHNSQKTLVDDEDFERLNAYTWGINGGYACGGPGHNTMLHHMLLQRKVGFEVDHINKDKLDNQKHNLRLVTHAQNCSNHKLYKNNPTGFHGVSRLKDVTAGPRFRARIGKRALGCYATIEGAARAYDKAALAAYGAFAQLNFPS